MKNTNRLFCLILQVCLVIISLTGCSSIDEDTKAVIAAIDNIGIVTIDSENLISNAQDLYDHLNEEQKKNVDNYGNLVSAREEFNELKAGIVDDLILSIGNVTLNSEEAITEARKAYDKLTDAQKMKVQHYDSLELAQEQFNMLKAEEVDYLIDSIGDVTLDSEDEIKAAKTAYNQLTVDQRELVHSYGVLTSAEERLAELKEAERLKEITLNLGDTVTSTDWSITLTNAYTSNTLSSSESRTYWEASSGYAFLILEFDVTCLNSTKPTIDDDGITELLATVNGNTYSNWEYQYIASELWLYIQHTYLDANLPVHIYVYTYIPSANLNDKVSVNLKIAGQEKVISIN